uniref:chemerin-like receptor 1 n=1 Tax=Pristiophorus japonicus TaxID=55135 RepID=UPI00398E32FE
MDPEHLQLVNSSDVPTDVPATADFSSVRRGMRACVMAIYIISCVLGVLGNGLVIWATGFKLKRTAYTVWLLSLAVADFIFSLLLPLFTANIALDNHWPFGWLLCKLSHGALVLCLYASIFTLAAISLDRCISLVLPVWSRNHRGPRLATLLSLGVWVAAAFFSAPSFAFQRLVPQDNRTMCSGDYLLDGKWSGSPRYPRYRALTLVRFLSAFLLPFLVIATSYAIIRLQLRRHRLAPSGGKPFRIMAAIILAFLLCWAPYHIVSVLALLLRPQSEMRRSLLVMGVPFSYSLACVSSCINPVLYIFMWQDFRDMLKKSLQRDKNQRESMHTNIEA